MGQRCPLGNAHPLILAHAGILLARRSHSARNGRRGGRRGYGRGWGRGYGRGWYNNPPVTVVPPVNPQAYVPATQQLPEQEVATLENYIKNLNAEKADLEQELGDVKARIEELKTKTAKQ